MSKRPPLHLSPLWDTEGLCSDSATNPPLNKGFCLTEQAARETCGRNYHLEAAPGNGTLAPQNINASGDSQCAQSWNHSENWTQHHESRLKIDSWKYIGTDKRPLFGKRQWGTHTLTCMHTNRENLPGWPVGICLCLLFAFVPSFSLLLGLFM